MENGYFKLIEKITGYNEKTIEHKNAEEVIEYTEIERLPIVETQKVWTLYSEEQKAEMQISTLKAELCETDYKTLKYVDGDLSEEEYETVKQLRKLLRQKINALEAQTNTTTET